MHDISLYIVVGKKNKYVRLIMCDTYLYSFIYHSQGKGKTKSPLGFMRILNEI